MAVDRHDDPDRGVTRGPVGRAVWVRLILFAVLAVVAVLVAVVVGMPDVESLRVDISAAGPVAPVLFVLLYAVATLAPLPKNVLSALGGVLFGLVPGAARRGGRVRAGAIVEARCRRTVHRGKGRPGR